MLNFKNTYAELPQRFYEKIHPDEFQTPQLIVFNEQLGKDLGFDISQISHERVAKIFSGQELLVGSAPLAQAYAGYQFGHPVPQLGDGRAHLLGEVNGFDIQLKGSGRTRFSRRGDGRSALGPVLREYLVSEAMHALGVPTTRALCAVITGEDVIRQNGPEPGGIFTRVASSHLRVGTFQYFSFQQDLEAIEILLQYTLKRHYPHLLKLKTNKEKSLAFLKEFISKQSDLIAQWSALGFIHGVMNTDNFSLAGITIDYGPCAFMDEFNYHKVFSSIDRHGRYSFFNQVPIAKWNILRLADCLLPLIDHREEVAIKTIESELLPLMNQFDEKRIRALAKKMGIEDYTNSDESLVITFLDYLEEQALDFTLAFRNLPQLFGGDKCFYPKSDNLNRFVKTWQNRVQDVDHLNDLNPLIIPRNHQVERVIDSAYENDFSVFHQALMAFTNPFEQSSEGGDWSLPPKDNEKVTHTFCGT